MSPKRALNSPTTAYSASDDSAIKPLSKDFADKLRQRMADLFPGEAQFITANRFGINPSYLSNILNLRVPPPSLEKVLSIAEVLQIDPFELACLAGYYSPTKTPLIMQRRSEARRISQILNSLNTTKVSVSLDDIMAMILGKYIDIRETDGIEALIDFIVVELVPGLSSIESWAGREGSRLRMYRGIGEGLLKTISIMNTTNQRLENLRQGRGPDTRQFRFDHSRMNHFKSTGEQAGQGQVPEIAPEPESGKLSDAKKTRRTRSAKR